MLRTRVGSKEAAHLGKFPILKPKEVLSFIVFFLLFLVYKKNVSHSVQCRWDIVTGQTLRALLLRCVITHQSYINMELSQDWQPVRSGDQQHVNNHTPHCAHIPHTPVQTLDKRRTERIPTKDDNLWRKLQPSHLWILTCGFAKGKCTWSRRNDWSSQVACLLAMIWSWGLVLRASPCRWNQLGESAIFLWVDGRNR